MALLEVRELQTKFRTRGTVLQAVDGVSFDVEAGETTGLVGESGCGKSVTALSLMRLLPAEATVEGRVTFDGESLLELSDAAMRRTRGDRMAMIFQDPMTSLNPVLSVGQQIAETIRAHRQVRRAAARARAIELLELVGIPAPARRVDDYPHQFSGGMRQRVMIAMALACDPKLILADEITTALDVTIQAQILSLIRALARDSGTAFVLITHDLGVIASMTQRVLVMYAGTIVEAAETRELFQNPQMPYTWGLLRSMPRLDRPRSTKLIPIEGSPPDLTRPIPGCRFEPRCPYRRDICREREPSLAVVATSSGDHASRCWGTQDVPDGGWLIDIDWQRQPGDARVLANIRREATATTGDPAETTSADAAV